MNDEPLDPQGDQERISAARQRIAERRMRASQSLEHILTLGYLEKDAQGLLPLLQAALSGLLAGLGVAYGQRALIIAGILLAPRLAALFGLALSGCSGDLQHIKSFWGQLAAQLSLFGALAAATAAVAGFFHAGLYLAGDHALFNLLDFGLLILAGIAAALQVAVRRDVPPLAGLGVAYEVLLPLAASVSAAVRGEMQLALGAAVIFAMHLVWGVSAAAGGFFVAGFRPQGDGERSWGRALLVLLPLALLSMLTLGGALLISIPEEQGPRMETPHPASTPAATAQPTIARTEVPAEPPTLTATPSATATQTQTPTPIPTPTPRVAKIYGTGGLGAHVRDAPGGSVVGSYLEGVELVILAGPETQNGQSWYQVLTPEGIQGWILGRLIATATPVP